MGPWFKGDIIEFIEDGEDDSTQEYFTVGEYYTILKVNEHEEHADKNRYMVQNDHGEQWWIEPQVFRRVKKFVKKKPVSEIEFLDAFKQNFKDGV